MQRSASNPMTLLLMLKQWAVQMVGRTRGPPLPNDIYSLNALGSCQLDDMLHTAHPTADVTQPR